MGEEARTDCELRRTHAELEEYERRADVAPADSVIGFVTRHQVAAQPSRASTPIPVDRIRVFAAALVRVVQSRTPSVATPRVLCSVSLKVKAIRAVRTVFVGAAVPLLQVPARFSLAHFRCERGAFRLAAWPGRQDTTSERGGRTVTFG